MLSLPLLPATHPEAALVPRSSTAVGLPGTPFRALRAVARALVRTRGGPRAASRQFSPLPPWPLGLDLRAFRLPLLPGTFTRLPQFRLAVEAHPLLSGNSYFPLDH